MQLNSDYYDTDFEMNYKGNTILVRNDGPEGESLYVNGELQDQNFSAHNGHLIGHILDEENNKEVIEVVLGGLETSDCLIYANGSLIHSNTIDKEFIDPFEVLEEEKKEKRKRRSSIFFPFLVIILMALCLIILFPRLYGDSSNSKETEPQETQPTNSVVQSSGDSGTDAAIEDHSTQSAGEYIDVNYSWNYGEGTWTYSLKIPKSAYEDYKTVDRKKIRDYSYYVMDQSDDEYLAGLADKFKEAAEKEKYSDLDMVNNIIFFVQSLEYLDDKIGTGYDEYPKFPLETLADQGGDCEDSAILLASLLRELGYGTVLVQFPSHMGVGIKGEDTMPGSYFEVDGSKYFYVETTSAGWEIGEIPDQMKDQRAKILPLNK